jgi:hypothetical protein
VLVLDDHENGYHPFTLGQVAEKGDKDDGKLEDEYL